MTRDTRPAGVGALTFAVSLVVGFTLFGPKGGRYSAAEIDSFLAQTSSGLIISIALLVISVIGLIVVMAHLSETSSGTGRRAIWATSLVAAASFLIGWGLYLSPYTSIRSGGPALDPGVSYVFLSAGMVTLFGVGGIALGIALITLAVSGGVTPVWVRATSGFAGVSALITWPFLVALQWSPNQWLPGPFYLVILWGLIMGVWLLVSPGRPDLARD